MDTLFIHATIDKKVELSKEAFTTLPKSIGLFTNIQHVKQLPRIKKQLEEQGKEVKIIGQTLGCRAEAASTVTVEGYLFIGSGDFHPLLVSWQSKKPVYCYDPDTQHLRLIPQEEIDTHKKKKHAQLVKFLHAENVGILITTKIGQNDNKINKFSEELKMKGAEELLKKGDKNYYTFAFDTLELDKLEDFPFIDCWVNTACSRIADEKTKLINLDDVRQFYAEQEVEKNKGTGTLHVIEQN